MYSNLNTIHEDKIISKTLKIVLKDVKIRLRVLNDYNLTDKDTLKKWIQIVTSLKKPNTQSDKKFILKLSLFIPESYFLNLGEMETVNELFSFLRDEGKKLRYNKDIQILGGDNDEFNIYIPVFKKTSEFTMIDDFFNYFEKYKN